MTDNVDSAVPKQKSLRRDREEVEAAQREAWREVIDEGIEERTASWRDFLEGKGKKKKKKKAGAPGDDTTQELPIQQGQPST
jgi:hypothetical protein